MDGTGIFFVLTDPDDKDVNTKVIMCTLLLSPFQIFVLLLSF
jgi:hypothetical protein